MPVTNGGNQEQDPFLPPSIYYCLSESDELRVPAWKSKLRTTSVLKGGLKT